MATDRKTKSTTDARVRNHAGDSRASRSAADAPRTEHDGTTMSSADRKKMLRDEFRQEALPRVPDIPGYHTCWLSTTSSYDPIHKRIRMGYEPVKLAEVPGMESFRMGTGEYEGAVACNEMLLFKIPNELYQEIMREFHHDGPQREEEAIKSQLKQGAVDSEGKELEHIEGFDDIGTERAAPQFT
jgi:hypothetical protein